MICKARVHDVKEIHELLEQFASKNVVLPRSLYNLYGNLRDFHIYRKDSNSPVLGFCALHICWEDLAEIRSMVVRETVWRRGIGTKLVRKCLLEARQLGVKRVFLLTYIPSFFERFGFRMVEKSTLPQKIWADCIHCVKFPECDEIAMLREP